MPGIDIEFKSGGQDAITAGLLKSADAADRVSLALERMAGAGRAAALPALIRPSSAASATSLAPSRLPSGPYQRRDRLAAQGPAVMASGDASKVADYNLEVLRNQKQIARAEKKPPSTADKLLGVLKTSRFGADGLMPLVGKTMELLGPVGSVVGALAIAGKEAADALYKMTEDAAGAGKAFMSLGFAGGGTGQETARLAGIGNALGISPEQMGAAAQSFNTAITTDPFAMQAGGALGVQNSPGPFGQQDWSGNLIKAIDNLRNIKDPNTQLLLAREAHLEQFLPITKMSDDNWNQMKQDASANSGVFSDQQQTASLEFLASQNRMKDGLDMTSAALMGPFMGALTGIQTFVANELHSSVVQSGLSGAGAAAMAGLPGGFIISALTDIFGGKSGKSGTDDNTKALNDNTKAQNANTAIMQQGAYGNGERFQAVTRDIQGGEYLNRSLEQSGFRLGAF